MVGTKSTTADILASMKMQRKMGKEDRSLNNSDT